MKASSAGSWGVLRGLASIVRDGRGVAAVEFALVLPLLIGLYLGLNEVQPGFAIKRKLALATRTLADLTTRSGDLSTADLQNIFAASTAVMRPYDNTGITQMVISSIAVTKSGSTYTGTVEWSCPKNLPSSPTADDLKRKTTGATYTVPAGFQNDSTKSFVLVETQYPYTPNIGYKIIGTIRMGDSVPWPVRDVDRVKNPGTCP